MKTFLSIFFFLTTLASSNLAAKGVVGNDPTWSLKFIYGDVEEGCPDLKDSIYLTPTSDDPYEPLEIYCALGQNSRGLLPGYEFSIPKKFNHKKFIKLVKETKKQKKDSWCTLDLHKYANPNWFDKDWKK